MDRPRVLFLCAHNAARSQMAEALLRHHAGEHFEVCSAGLEPTEIHPLTRQVLEEIGVDTTRLRAEGLDRYLAKTSVQYAIIVCEKTQAQCPRLYPFAQQTLFWPFEDPAAFHGPADAMLRKFRDVRDQVEERLLAWVSELPARPDEREDDRDLHLLPGGLAHDRELKVEGEAAE